MKNKTNHIHVLADNVINKIAAGEVVERPSSVVKELVENSLDAGATDIRIEIVEGGRTLVSVADNGSGMDRNNTLLSIERHATSKIADVDDIEHVSTLGFRGEALAAISAVSRFTLRTRRADDLAGTELVMAGGKIQEVRDAGCAPGTIVEVRHLFFNVPARRKFLRAEQTETTHVRQVFITYALANPSVAMKLKADGKQLYNLPANASLEDRLNDLFNYLPNNLRKVAHLSGNVNVSGYIGLPSLTRADRAEQYIFINRRPSSAGILSGSIREGYKTLLPKERYPVVFLFLELEPDLVDVNVHPAKKEVRFRNPVEARNAVAEAIRLALANRPPSFVPLPTQSGVIGTSTSAQRASVFAEAAPDRSVDRSEGSEKMPAVAVTSQMWDYSGLRRKAPTPAGRVDEAAKDKEKVSAVAEEGRKKLWAWCRVVGQIGSLYVVLETEDGLVLMDPHAAHERVLFEKFMAEITRGHVESQALLMAESVVLSPADAQNLRQALEVLKKMGFGIAEFGQDTFVVDAIPSCFGNVAAHFLVSEIAAGLAEYAGRTRQESILEEQIAQAACRASVKAHTRLSENELESLIAQLENTEMPYTCPHGRPVIIHFSFQELARKFGRTVPGG
jgi:DNA mismatch repair protein MutL